MTREAQCAEAVLLVRPATVASNPETLATNRFQRAAPAADADRAAALAEFDALAAALAAHVRVHAFPDTPAPPKPDAPFPNNWLSTHADGTVVLYPMLAPSRRAERRRDLVEALAAAGPYRVSRIVDLSPHEAAGRFLEGTGSLVLDRAGRVAWACRSPRTDERVLAEFARELDYEPVVFDARGPDGAPVYHTNVVVWIGERVAVVCAEAIPPPDRPRVLDRLAVDRAVVEISAAQMAAFAGNMLELRSRRGGTVLAMSACAAGALERRERDRLAALAGAPLVAPIPTIERLGGGSVRCMLAEVFLPRG